ncbi:hypothetical protein EH165_12175 [Nakamurella antarctica]|uniref:DUF5666 domain-containing protein n=1 Tax=Nakamurella antarctica TaxID=1902245 RepID=A0A3G8ZPQ9_9ACTN|nr:hypothetical protein [Nakamurella antarctica]AZI58777.1 hypothetical protein EH165_12175 [Nakamurella antarctica]
MTNDSSDFQHTGVPAAPLPPKKDSLRFWSKQTLAGAAVVAVVIGAGLGISGLANADTPSTSAGTSVVASDAPGGAAASGAASKAGRPGGHRPGQWLKNHALHGEFVVSVPVGKGKATASTETKTIRVQFGKITGADATSVTVLSTDGFSATYVPGAKVNVSTLAVGDEVTVRASVVGDVVTAEHIGKKGERPVGVAGNRGGTAPGAGDTAPGAPADSGSSSSSAPATS